MNKKTFTTHVFVIIMLSMLFFSFNKIDHDPLYSTTILIEQEDGSWVLQIYSALTAFEHEVHTNYGKDSYKTPEEFNTLVIQHVLKNLSITINSKNTVSFKNGYVKLGHEASAVFEVVGIPKKATKVQFTNSSFKDVYNNQNTLMILKKGFKKQIFLLNDSNQHSVELKVSNNQFAQK
ncbi:MAG: hypothetical protein NTX74_09780 [Flavobacterium sp.]|nr:hypothetical protein [Flavobacterium sp.]